MINTIMKDAKVADALDYGTGTTTRTSAIIDTAGFEGCAFIVKLATIASSAVNTVTVASGDDSGMSDGADLLGSSQVVAADDDNQVRVVDIFRPKERYLQLSLNKDGTNACAESAVAILYGAHNKPTTLAADVEGELHVSPAEGTA